MEGESVAYECEREGTIYGIHIAPSRKPDGEIEGCIGCATDLTTLKRSQEDLERWEARNQALLEILPDLIFHISRDNVFLDFQAGREDSLYVPPREFLGKPIREVLPPEVARVVEEGLQDAFATGSPTFIQYQLPIGGELRDFEARAIAREDDRGIVVVRDVTDRKRAERELRKTEDRLTTVVANAPLVLFALDRDGYFTLSEGKGLESIGLKPGEVVGMSAFELYKAFPRIIENIHSALRGQHASEVLDVGGVLFDSLFAPLHAEDGTIEGVIGVATDVTVHKRAEMIQKVLYEIAEASVQVDNLDELFHVIHQTLATIIDAQNFFIALYDTDRDMVSVPYLSDERDHISGIPKDRLGKTLTGRVLRTGKPLLCQRAEIEELIERGEIEQVGAMAESWLAVPLISSGTVVGSIGLQSYTTGKALTEDDMNVLSFVSHQIARTIERKQAEEERRRNEARFREIYEKSPVMMHSVDRDGTVLDVNEKWLEETGYTREEIIGKKLETVMTPESANRRDSQIMPEYMRTGSVREVPYQYVRKDGRLIDVLVNSNRLRDPLFSEVKLSVVRNVTQQKRYEEALRRLVAGTAAVVGEEFFHVLVSELAGALDNRFALIAERDPEYPDSTHVLAFCDTQNPLQKTIQPPANSPCARVAEANFYVCESGLEKEFPDNVHISTLGIESYMGLALRDSHGEVIGQLCVFDTKTMESKDQMRSILSIFASRAGAELERQREERKRRESEERYALAARGANDGLWDWNLRTNRIYLSPRWKTMLGYDEDEVGDSPSEWMDRIHPEDRDRVKAEIDQHLDRNTAHFESEHRVRHRDGAYRWMLCRGLAVGDRAGQLHRMAGSQTDITERKVAEEQLLQAAYYDALTGLPNRAYLMDRLWRSIIRSRDSDSYQYAVLFFDLDRFKNINDSLGHTLGDQLLIALAERLKSCVRTGDVVARLGGDEFTVLLEGISDVSDATSIADKVLREITTPFNLGGHIVYTNGSIGIALSHSGYQRPEDLLRDADTAMYSAKELGKARYMVFDRGMHDRAVALLQLETDLQHAVAREEFRVFYQPIVSLRTGLIECIEGLARWQHPYRGLVMPGDFIPAAEETGLIIPMGLQIMREACRQLQEWKRRFGVNAPQAVCVNLSARQFMQPDIVEQVKAALDESGLDGNSLQIEITESILMQDIEAAMEHLARLKDLDIRLCIDDFGTGYSSLSYLQRFPIDTLKIDRSFVSNRITLDENLEIVRTIVTLAHNLEMSVIAEGVETEEELAQLRALRCNHVQGNYFSKPVAAGIINDILSDGVHYW
ncbi:EAL domain-containing protein [bacterium]|nr:EAL domain-containing protein [bacterium]